MGLKIAIPEGRLLPLCTKALEAIGIEVPKKSGRKLSLQKNGISFLFSKSFDVPLYVEQGIDLGIAGGDVVLERGCDLFVPLELDFGRCRLSLITHEHRTITMDDMEGYRIGTKYPKLTQAYFAQRGISIKVLPFSGAIELGLVLGICDAIVDIVDSGRTIQENGLTESEVLMNVGAMLMVNRIAQKKHFDRINEIVIQLNEEKEKTKRGGVTDGFS